MTYLNNTNTDVRAFDAVIVEAMANGGIFEEDFADIFVLVKTPAGSAADYVLDFAETPDHFDRAYARAAADGVVPAGTFVNI